MKRNEFETHKETLMERVNQVGGSLNAMGLRTIQLTTEELVELLYNSYNFNTASQIRIKKVEELDLVRPQE